jgi:CBS domain containing-hemolysin-like protein
VASVTLTIFIIVFAEALPKVTARANSIAAANWLIVPIYLIDKLLSPFTWALVHFMGIFLSRVGHPNVSLVTEEDIKQMIELGTESGTIHEDEKKMMHSILKFTDTKVNEVMVPRTEMFCVDVATGLDKLLELVVQNGYSRMPVYKGNLDNIVGIVNTRDLLAIWKNKELIVLQDLLRKTYFVPETMRVDRLLHEFKRGNIHMAVVVDEYGGTAGLVTLEDLVEEIVGEIRDEYDVEEEKPINKQEDGTWLIDAGVALDEVNEALGVHLKPKGDVATLGGYLTERVGRMPRKGRVFDDREVVFTVLDASDRRVNKVKALKRELPLPESSEEQPVPKPKKRKPKQVKPKESQDVRDAAESGENQPAAQDPS